MTETKFEIKDTSGILLQPLRVYPQAQADRSENSNGMVRRF